jgi:hypothetical protein
MNYWEPYEKTMEKKEKEKRRGILLSLEAGKSMTLYVIIILEQVFE